MGLTASITLALHNMKDAIGNAIISVSGLSDRHSEYEQLLAELEQSQIAVHNMQALEQENRSLRRIVQYSQSLEYAHAPAEIVGKDPGGTSFSLLINKGNRHGIDIGMPVVAFQDGRQGLVGRVVDISWNSALIRPLVHPKGYVAGRLTKTRYEGLLQGLDSESGLLRMKYLERESRNQVSVGDEVISSGLNSLYPPNLFIGTVTSISARSYTASLELDVTPFINFARLEHVFVLLINENTPK